ncbi:MAG: hypothetical protein J5725_04425 [Bacteroidales bacterium]|nr:hypothetical protein [Bacteroidales bacterium]
MNNDLINRNDLIDVKPEFMNEKVVRDTKYRTAKDRIYAKAWNACNSYWLNTIKNAPTVEISGLPKIHYDRGFIAGYEKGKNERPQGEWILQYRSCGDEFYTCSLCKKTTEVAYNSSITDFSFCPYCGAEMQKL